MMDNWLPLETTTHQDHVVAHVLDATVLGYFVYDESIYLLLDIGFIWRVYLDCEMGLSPYSVAIADLETDEDTRQLLKSECELLLKAGSTTNDLRQMTLAPSDCLITGVSILAKDNQRRLILESEATGLVIETSLTTAAISVS